ncbi:MAG: sugar phosphate isomerase/epimerase [Planctomycetes bacterium]|jgi:sugar phosphate isomerase/epimerase|nr:sugar phosphate isomerase/epimerase [Planctomycetota bacterium]
MSFKTALHSVSYAGVWTGQARLPLPDFLRKAKALGYDGVMLMAKRPHLSVLEHDAKSCEELRRLLGDLSLNVICLAGYNDFALGRERPDIPMSEMQVLYVRELARLAQMLDCRLIRIFTSYDDLHTPYDQQWTATVSSLKECARQAADFGVTLGVQNHHDMAAHYETMFDLLEEIGEPNCKVMFDAWAPALQGMDLKAAVLKMAPYIVHTTVADYVRRPRFHYQPALVNYTRAADSIRAVPMGEGFIDYRAFFKALVKIGYRGHVAYEMCSPLRGGGSEANLDSGARRFLEYMKMLQS